MLRTFLLLSAALCCLCVGAQAKTDADYSTSSGFRLDSLDARNPQVIQNLETLARVWGYAKYHHPIFSDSTSTLNVDYELFELLPKVTHADKATRNRILYEWVRGLGAYRSDKPMYDQGLAGMQLIATADLGWTADTLRLGRDLSALLQDLRYAERDQENRYVHSGMMVEGWGWQPLLHKESFYNRITNFDSGYNLLALFRFWNIIEYYAPNMPKTDKPWGEVLTEYIPLIGVETDMRTFQQHYMRMNCELSDGHANSPLNLLYFGDRTLPIRTQSIDGNLLITDPGKIVGLQRGDQIVRVDGCPIGKRLEEIRRYHPVSNEAGYLQKYISNTLNSNKASYTLHYLRNGITDSLTINTVPVAEFDWIIDSTKIEQGTYRLLNDSVGYLYTGTFTASMYEDAMKFLHNTKVIIFDLRTYPVDRMPLDQFVGEYLLEKPTPYAQWSDPTLALPGVFFKSPPTVLYRGASQGITAPSDNPEAYRGRIIALVNENTQSAAECSVMALQTIPGTLVIGSQTAGANGDIAPIPMPGGLSALYSGVGCYYPDGYDMQRKGVKIDIQVRPTAEGIRAGRDEVLEKALETIRSGRR